ncbi:MAG: hypothetical protein AMXMBFR33_57920 [Candidatus Xenobia bacterium]
MPTLIPSLTPASPAPEPAATEAGADEELVAAAAQLAGLASRWEQGQQFAAARLSAPEVLAGAREVSVFLAEVQSCIRAGWNLDLTADFCRQRLARGPGYLAGVAVEPRELFSDDWEQQRRETLRAGGSVALRSLSEGPAARLEVAQELLEGGAWWDRAATVDAAARWLQRALDNRGRRWRPAEATRLGGRGHVWALDAPLDDGDDGDSIPPLQVPSSLYSALPGVEEAPLHLELLQGLFARLKPEARQVVALHIQGFPWAEAGKEAGVDELATERAKRAWNRVLVAFRKKFPDYDSWVSRNA